MKIEFKIQENDFLEFQLFTSSKSKRIQKKKRNAWLILTIASVIFALYFFCLEILSITIYFVVTSVLIGIFYPKYFNWRYKRHYKNHIKENYKNRFGETEDVEFGSEYIYTKSKIGEGKVFLKEIEKINETSNHFFLKISTGMSLIIPKREINDITELREKFQTLGFTINDELNWNWK
ncbi:MAG: YcxB family protein [Bacteroidales bacterium]|nr:YcxB family protein [Bacteroidales bacterium]